MAATTRRRASGLQVDLIRQYDYSYADYDRPHNVVFNFIYQTPKVASGVLGYS